MQISGVRAVYAAVDVRPAFARMTDRPALSELKCDGLLWSSCEGFRCSLETSLAGTFVGLRQTGREKNQEIKWFCEEEI